MIKIRVKIPIKLRYRRRYIKFRVIGREVESGELMNTLWKHLIQMEGVLNLDGSALKLIEYENGEGIIRTTHRQLSKVLACMGTIECETRGDWRIDVLDVSGTIRKLNKSERQMKINR